MAGSFEEGVSRERPPSLESSTATQLDHDESDNNDKPSLLKTSWKSLFRFTSPLHIPALLTAILFTLAAGIIRVVFALYLGKLFQILSQFGNGAITGTHMLEQARAKTFVLLVLGGLTWLLSSCFLFCWIVFSELQVRRAGEVLFEKLLHRDLMWFDMRKDGGGSFLSHSQKQVSLSSCIWALGINSLTL
jgi:ATP-binding cassette, subfamily B (MDR/TAP), member 1